MKNPIFGIPGRGDDDRNLAVITRAYGVMKQHAWAYEDVQPVAPVAIVWSHRTLEMYGRDDPRIRYAENFYGLYAALVESHLPCMVVGDDWLTSERLKDFRAVALPNVTCLSAGQNRALAGFVRDGGGLVATYQTSLYDESGARRNDFGLTEVLGVHASSGNGEVDRFNFRNRLPDTRRMIEGALRWALAGDVPLRTNAPGGVALTLWRKPAFLFIHFVNTVGRSPLVEVAELAGIECAVRVAAKVKTVRTLLGAGNLEFTANDGEVRFRLPRLGDCEVVVLDRVG